MPKYLFLLFFMLNSLLLAEDMDSLLTEFSQKSDLSSKTKNENSGHLLIYTRNDLDKMQAKSLKDVLKSTTAFTYEESRYNLPDMYNSEQLPYRSNGVRLYIDNQEMTSAIYGSGMALFGDIPLGFVDHIEVYMGTPSYKFSTQTAFLIVKLYSKDAKRDLGGELSTQIANDGYNQTFVNYIDVLDDIEYQIYTNLNNNKQDYIKHKGHSLSKNKVMQHLFVKVKKDTLKVNLHVLQQENDAFINRSLDATPEDSLMEDDFYNLNLEKSFYDEKLNFYIDHSKIYSKYNFNDDNSFTSNPTHTSYSSDLSEDVTTIKTTYEDTFGNNNLFLGLDFRNKSWKYKSHMIGTLNLPSSGYDNQKIYSTYLQDEYILDESSILTFGVKYSEVKNNGSIKSDSAVNYRVGHIHTTENFTFKTYYNDSQMIVEPYLISSDYGSTDLKKERNKLLSHETSYETDSNKATVIFGYAHLDDAIMYDYTTRKVFNVATPLLYKYFVFKDEFQVFNFKNFFSIFISERRNIPVVEQVDYQGASLRTLYTYDGYDMYGELIYRKNDESSTNYFDLSLGVKKEIYKDLTIAFKGENLLNKAYATTFNILEDPTNFTSSDTLESEHIPKRLLLTLEYRF